MTLGLKLGRRLLAACALDGEQFVFRDSRFVTAPHALEVAGLGRYLQQLIAQLRPQTIYYYAPTLPNTRTARLIALLLTTAGEMGVPAKPLSRLDLFGSFGVLPVRTRQELCDLVGQIWPALAEEHRHRQTTLAEAAATALVGDLRQRWPLV
jgi:hypothetical protein